MTLVFALCRKWLASFCASTDLVFQGSNSLDCYLNLIAGRERPNSSRCTREHDVARQQRHNLGDVPDDVVQRENEDSGVRGLLTDAIYACFHLNAGPRVNLISHNRPDGTERIESLCSPPL